MQTACIGPCFGEPISLNIFHLAPAHSPILGLLMAAYGTSRRKTEQPIRNLLLDFKHGAAGKGRRPACVQPLVLSGSATGGLIPLNRSQKLSASSKTAMGESNHHRFTTLGKPGK